MPFRAPRTPQNAIPVCGAGTKGLRVSVEREVNARSLVVSPRVSDIVIEATVQTFMVPSCGCRGSIASQGNLTDLTVSGLPYAPSFLPPVFNNLSFYFNRHTSHKPAHLLLHHFFCPVFAARLSAQRSPGSPRHARRQSNVYLAGAPRKAALATALARRLRYPARCD